MVQKLTDTFDLNAADSSSDDSEPEEGSIAETSEHAHSRGTMGEDHQLFTSGLA